MQDLVLSDQGLNLGPLRGWHEVLAAGALVKSPRCYYFTLPRSQDEEGNGHVLSTYDVYQGTNPSPSFL